jgi:hypothetical protein
MAHGRCCSIRITPTYPQLPNLLGEPLLEELILNSCDFHGSREFIVAIQNPFSFSATGIAE